MDRYILLWPYIMVESYNLTQPLPPGFGVSDPPHWQVQLCQLLPSDASSQGPSNHQWEGLAPQTPGQADGKVDGSSEGFSFIYIAPQILSIGCFGRFSNCKKTDGLNVLGLGFFFFVGLFHFPASPFFDHNKVLVSPVIQVLPVKKTCLTRRWLIKLPPTAYK